MPNYPVNVRRTEDGSYEASLADLENGPVGVGVDPYAALEDLSGPARARLAELRDGDGLPDPSPADERPVIEYDPDAADQTSPYAPAQITDPRSEQFEMVGYSWTSTSIF
jgi:hypothetical protein